MPQRKSVHLRCRVDYSQRRPRSSLGHLAPNEFVEQRQIIRAVEEVVGSR